MYSSKTAAPASPPLRPRCRPHTRAHMDRPQCAAFSHATRRPRPALSCFINFGTVRAGGTANNLRTHANHSAQRNRRVTPTTTSASSASASQSDGPPSCINIAPVFAAACARSEHMSRASPNVTSCFMNLKPKSYAVVAVVPRGLLGNAGGVRFCPLATGQDVCVCVWRMWVLSGVHNSLGFGCSVHARWKV